MNKAIQFENIPQELKDLNQWCLFRCKVEVSGKVSKTPVQTQSPTSYASCNVLSTLATFEDTKRAYRQQKAHSIGVSILHTSLIGIDLDNCLEDGKPNELAQELLSVSAGITYAERTVSGKGLRAWFRCNDDELEKLRGFVNTKKIEIYRNSHFFTVSGQITQKSTKTIGNITPDVWKFIEDNMPRRIERNLPPIDGGISADEQLAKVQSALDSIDPDFIDDDVDEDLPYDKWLNVLMAIHSLTHGTGNADHGLQLAIDWSSGGSSYEPGEVESRWKGFKKGGNITIRTLFLYARRAGWKDPFFIFSNCDKDQKPYSQRVLLEHLDAIGMRLGICRDTLFHIEKGRFTTIERAAKLFSTIGHYVERISWRGGAVGKDEFFEAVKAHVPIYADVELTPHIPPVQNIAYINSTIPSVAKLEAERSFEDYIDLFNPATASDRELMRAAVATVCWGGQQGARPLIAVTSASESYSGQIASGKSTFVEITASIPNLGKSGHITRRDTTSWDRTFTHLVDVTPDSRRVLMFDNIKSLLGGEELESLITSRYLDGHKLHTGNRNRANYICCFVTGNGLRCTEDIASRLVSIQIGQSLKSAEWQDRVSKLDYWKLLAGVEYFFKRPVQPLKVSSRFPTWDREVLSRCQKPDELFDLIASRREQFKDSNDTALEIKSELVRLLSSVTNPHSNRDLISSSGAYNPDFDSVYIPTSIACEALQPVFGKISNKSFWRTMREGILGHKLLPELLESRNGSYRGLYWKGKNAKRAKVDYSRFPNRLAEADDTALPFGTVGSASVA